MSYMALNTNNINAEFSPLSPPMIIVSPAESTESLGHYAFPPTPSVAVVKSPRKDSLSAPTLGPRHMALPALMPPRRAVEIKSNDWATPPSYTRDPLPSLETWLSPLRRDESLSGDDNATDSESNTQRASFAALTHDTDDWMHAHSTMARALSSWGLAADPFAADVNMPPSHVEHPYRWLPEELRSVALWMTKNLATSSSIRNETFDISPSFTTTVQRRAALLLHASAATCNMPLHNLPDLEACLPSGLSAPLQYCGLNQADYDRLVRALFLLQCRAVWSRRAQDLIRRRTSSKVYRAVSKVFQLPRGTPVEGARRQSEIIVAKRRWSITSEKRDKRKSA